MRVKAVKLARISLLFILIFLGRLGSSSAWHWPSPLLPVILVPGEAMKIVTIDMPDFGLATRNAVDLAVAHHGGKIGGHPIRTQHFPFGCFPAAENEKFLKKITKDPQVVGVIGPICSGPAFQQVPVLSKAKILTISPANTAAELTEDEFHEANPYYYRTAPSDTFQGEAGGRFASAPVEQQGLGAATAAILYYSPEEAYSEVLREGFKRTFTGTVAGEFPIEFGQEDFSDLLGQLQALGVDVVYAPLFDEALFFYFQLREAGGSFGQTPFLGTDSLFFPDIFEFLGDDPVEFYVTATNSNGPKYEAFHKAYVKKFREEPNAFEPLAYDATRLMLKAIAAKSIKLGKFLVLNPRDLRRYMDGASHYPYVGAGGTYTDPHNGDLNPTGHSVFQGGEGEFTPIYP